ncbi:MAG: peptidoglycan-binding protein [Candidatus Omnitrophota bacterium]
MRLNFLVFLIFAFFLSGCATTKDLQLLKDKINSLEKEVKQRQDSEATLKENQGQLEEVLKKQFEANLLLRQQLAEAKEKADAISKKMDEDKSKLSLPSGKDIQTALKKAGFYKGVIDGNIGSETKDAIRKFQEINNLVPDGVVGSRTWSLLAQFLEQKDNLK